MIYSELYAQFGPGSDSQKSSALQDFSDQFFSGKDAKSQLCVWLKHALEHTLFHMCKETICQRVPNDWCDSEQVMEAAADI